MAGIEEPAKEDPVPGHKIKSPATTKLPSVPFQTLCDVQYDYVPACHDNLLSVKNKRTVFPSCGSDDSSIHCGTGTPDPLKENKLKTDLRGRAGLTQAQGFYIFGLRTPCS